MRINKKNIFFACSLGLLYIILTSDIDGAAHHGHGDLTGAPTAAVGHCQTHTCHGANNSLTIVQLKVLDTTTMLPISIYHAGQTYLIVLTGDATGVTTNLPGFGFQVSAVTHNDSLAGSYTIPSASSGNMHTYPCGATTVVEHSATLPQTTTGTNTYAAQFYWTAPTGTSDSVKFYSLLNAVNGDLSSSGDYPDAAPIVTIYEYSTTEVSSVIANSDHFTLYPIPATNVLNVSSGLEEISNLEIYDLAGEIIYRQRHNSKIVSIDVSNFPMGPYLIRINETEFKKFVKQ